MYIPFLAPRNSRNVPQARHRVFAVPAWRLSIAFAITLMIAIGGCRREEAPKQAAAATAETPARALFDASLTLANNGGRIDYSGTVDAAATRTALENTLHGTYDGGRADGEIKVDAAAKPAAWATGLEPLLRAFAPAYGAALRFEGERIVLSGQADDAMRSQLRAAARQAFPNAKLEGLFAEATISADLEAIVKAPDNDRPAAEQLAQALNRMPVRFDEGKGNVSAESLAMVAEAAKAIRAAPEGTRLLIVGPVVASKDAGNDIFLSKQRAEALKAQLILSGVNPGAIETRGWGQTSNGTAANGTATDSATADSATPPAEGAPMRFELLPAS